ncbi:DUF6880 family protein [Rhizobium sp. FY34]|uniref:DUF6880 family protein n=1 Tax=Rhizobium sp. FY34 TaxID=2562309 RepID=UPI0010C07066|nr:DUF6880 family protein [Rhizobium sp. FY34]
MAAKTTLNAKNLEALGTERLAALLIEISTGNAAHKRRLRLELAGSQGSLEVAREVRKRLVSLARARTFIDWRKVKGVKLDLETQRSTIVDTVAPGDPSEAFELIWQFLALAEPIFERSDDGNGTLIESFHAACADAGRLAQSAGLAPQVLADRVFAALSGNGYGQFDTLIAQMAQALGSDGLGHLRQRLQAWAAEPEEKLPDSERRVIGWGSSGPVYEDEIYGRHRDSTVKLALQAIADAEGDVDAYIAQQSKASLQSPMVATDIARRLLTAGRSREALAVLDKARPRPGHLIPFEWQQARIDALEAEKRPEEAQAYRWTCFEQSLDEDHLRAFVKRLPDFDDMEAEERGFAFVQAAKDVHQALAFFLRWPQPAEAAKLVLRRRTELDGDLYELMSAAAETLAEKHPLAATIALRAMIDFTLQTARSSRYKHAARHLLQCTALEAHISDFNGLPGHDAYVLGLQRVHGKKHGFWSLLRN